MSDTNDYPSVNLNDALNFMAEEESYKIRNGLLQECHLQEISNILRKNEKYNLAYMIDELIKETRDPCNRIDDGEYY